MTSMPEANKRVTKISSAFSAEDLPVAERENVVRERLYNLLTTLGELPLDAERPRPWGTSWSLALRAACPPGYDVLHGANLTERGLSIDDLVVGPAGLVVVGHTEEPERPGFSHRGASWKARPTAPTGWVPRSAGAFSGPGPGPVRETLRRAFALRAWLKGGEWDGVAVMAAVCSPQVPQYRSRPALLLDGLWVGAIDHLGPWLARSQGTDSARCAALTSLLNEQLGAR